jgi:phosphate transport system substrate-binding protein
LNFHNIRINLLPKSYQKRKSGKRATGDSPAQGSPVLKGGLGISLGLVSGYIFWQAWTTTTDKTFFLGLGTIAIILTAVWLAFTIKSSVRKEWQFELSLPKANPLLLLLVLFQGIALFWVYRSELGGGFQALSSNLSAMIQTNSQRPQASDCIAPASITKDRTAYVQVCTAMQDVLNVPAGQFFYGGTMGAAALRSQNFLDEIKRVHPEFQLRYLDPLSVPPDSGTGIKMLINGELSFAESQRPLRDAEYEKANNRDFTLKQVPVASTGVAFFTHPDLKLPGLSLEQIQGIYTGRFTNWKELGGPDVPIIPVSQDFDETGSTMSLLLQNLPPAAQRLGKKVHIVRDTTTALRAVGRVPGTIGYGAQALVVKQRSIRLLGLAKWRSSQYVQPATANGQVNKAALQNVSYPLIQRVFVVIRQDGTLDEIAGTAYANLLLSQKGQALIDQAGYLPIRLSPSSVPKNR